MSRVPPNPLNNALIRATENGTQRSYVHSIKLKADMVALGPMMPGCPGWVKLEFKVLASDHYKASKHFSFAKSETYKRKYKNQFLLPPCHI